MDVDYLIIGQGLAGSALALTLLRRGKRVAVVDNNYIDGASRVAAGVLNPVTGRWMVKTWAVDQALPAAKTFYRSMEPLLHTSVLEERCIARLCRSDFEIKRWSKRRQQQAYRGYVGEAMMAGELWHGLSDACGSFPILQGGLLDTCRWLDAVARYLQDKNALIRAPFKHEQVSISPEAVEWQGCRANCLVFCEGWAVRNNPWFGYLPLEASKGEVLTFDGQIPLPGYILHASKWIVPLPSGTQYRAGSTWQWNPTDAAPSEAGRIEMLRAVRTMLVAPPAAESIIAHQAGVRPASADRLPWLGRHPRQSRLVVFNGLGAKGALYAPWLAEILAEHLALGVPLPKEVDIARCGCQHIGHAW